jgi:hypothetical protein
LKHATEIQNIIIIIIIIVMKRQVQQSLNTFPFAGFVVLTSSGHEEFYVL